MKKSATFYGGEVYLDEVKFVNLNSSDKNVDGLKTGTVNVAFLRTPPSVANSKADKSLGGFDSFIQAGGMLLMNQGVKLTCKDGKPEPLCTGKPDGSDLDHAEHGRRQGPCGGGRGLDPAVINTRVNDGKGLPNNALFDSNFTTEPGCRRRQARCRRGEEVARRGQGGRLRAARSACLCTNQPERVALAQTLETQLKAVGFDVDGPRRHRHGDPDHRDHHQEGLRPRLLGLSIPNDDTAILALVQNFWSASPNNRVGYSEPRVGCRR